MDETHVKNEPLRTPRRTPRRPVLSRPTDHVGSTGALPMLLTADDAADLLRTTRRAVYAMVERHQLPGVIRLRRRVLFRADVLLDWLTRSARHHQRSNWR
ncbi:MAG: helix-turn-helix domain-containing protein [Acidobacteria bacterium]|nr:helix-turn-helix domain-containing protein [Acidobacteriota bacterium]